MTDGSLVPPHVVLPPLVVATRKVAHGFLPGDVMLSSPHFVMRPIMTVEVFPFCAAVVATSPPSSTFTRSFVIILMLSGK